MLPETISIEELIRALLDVDTPLPPRYLYRFSDLETNDLQKLADTWQKIPAWRRIALLEDIEELGLRDELLSFETLARFALKDENPAVRLPAVQTLWEFESKDLSRIFLNMMVNDTDGLVRASAAAGLGRFVFDGEVDKLSRNILKDLENQLIQVVNGKDEKQVRLRALESLGFSENPDVIPLIERAYRSTDNDWIAASLLAMGRSADNQWDAKVLKMLDSPISQLCTEAARAAGELEIHQAVPQLLELLEDEDEDTRLASVWALALIGGEGIREALEEMIETCDSEDEQDFIIEALEQLVFTEDRSILSFSDFEDADDLDY